MTAVATVQLEHALFIRTTPAQLWDALTNGEQTARYYYGSPVDSTWQPGADVNYLTPDRSAPMVGGRVLAIEPEKRLVLSLRLLYDPTCAVEAPFEQTWLIEDVGNGVCKLTVQQAVDPDSATYQQISGGMPLILSSLKSFVETGEGLPMQ
jgi:uncharacterized protein YndB with AHSA1/START domain